MNMIKRLILYLRLWLLKRLGYKLPSLREADSIVPGRLYDHFARIVRAIPIKKRHSQPVDYTQSEQCLYCDFRKMGIPCQFQHRLKDSSEDICEHHVFEVISYNHDNI